MEQALGILVAAMAAMGGAAAGWWLHARRVAGAAPPAPPDVAAVDGAGETESLTQAILDAAVDAIVIIDTKGIVHAFNRAAERIFGYTAAEVTGRNVSMLMPEPDRGRHDQYLRNYLETGEARIIGKGREVTGLRKDGTTFPMELAVGEALRGGAGRLFAGIVRDISIRKETEERLRHSEAKNRAILEAAVDGIVTIDEQGRIEGFNRAAERIFGYSAAEVLGRNVNVLMPAPYRQAHDQYLANYLGTGQARIIGIGREVEGKRKDGNTFPMDLAVGEGYLAGRRIFAGTVRDISERKRAEADLRHAKEEAERANLAKTKFLAAASHDLRQPVQSLVFFTSALSAQLPDGPARTMMRDMEMAVDALKMLLDSLLDVSKLDAGVVPAQPIVFPVGTILATMRANYAAVAESKGITLRVVPSSMVVRSDPALLGRLVQNLVDNALRYTRRGTILLGARRRGETLRVEVWDTGIGIAPEMTSEIFEEFTQIGNPERDRTQGLGLGLAIVKRLSRLLGHPVGVRSIPGQGSVFWVDVPAVPSARPRAATAPAIAAAAAHRGTIVLIDDEPVVLSSLRALLMGWGYEVVAATSAAEAVALLRAWPKPPSIILADYRLREGHTGTEAIRDLCQLYHQVIPSIIITGDTAPERLREAEASGISVLHKPVTPPVLLNALTETIGSA
ncbi:MAG TPA: PAS domain S-box protein [Azospirillum sp.]|nr:PAS domain S-box protein [Azospirillum sp.]